MRTADPFSTSSSANGCHHPSNHLDLHVNWNLFSLFAFRFSFSYANLADDEGCPFQPGRFAYVAPHIIIRKHTGNLFVWFVKWGVCTRSTWSTDECATGEWGTFGVRDTETRILSQWWACRLVSRKLEIDACQTEWEWIQPQTFALQLLFVNFREYENVDVKTTFKSQHDAHSHAQRFQFKFSAGLWMNASSSLECENRIPVHNRYHFHCISFQTQR